MTKTEKRSLFIKCVRVIKSCKTQDQLMTAIHYRYLAAKYLCDKANSKLQYLVTKQIPKI
jgi:hypothetical protein